MSFTRS